jgi:hypothetical protein
MLITRTRRRIRQMGAVAVLAAITFGAAPSAASAGTPHRGLLPFVKFARTCSEQVRVDFRFPERLPDVSHFTISLAIDEQFSSYQQVSTGNTQIFTKMVFNRPATLNYQIFSFLWDGSSRLLREQTVAVPAGWYGASWFGVYGDEFLQVGVHKLTQNCRS